jgi:cytochrome P450
MLTPVSPAELAGISVAELATSPAPGRWHETLRSLGVYQQDGAWIVSRPGDVAAALASAGLSVAPPPGDGGAADSLLRRMARFSDDPAHQRRRELVTSLLPSVPELVTLTADRVNQALRRRIATFDIMPLARSLPAAVLASAMGLSASQAEQAAELTGQLCDAVTPVLGPHPVAPDIGDEAAVELCALLAAFGRRADSAETAEAAVAAASILFQARDATAALIGLTVLAGQTGLTPGWQIDKVLRHVAPVQCTRRFAIADTAIGTVTVPAGAQMWIFVAAAERGTGIPATFGSGLHACPGASQAIAIARQVVTVLQTEGWHAAAGQRIELEPRPNVRVPRRVLMSRL